MTQNMQIFLEALSARSEIAWKLNIADRDELIAIAASLGLQLSSADFECEKADSGDERALISGSCRCNALGIAAKSAERCFCPGM